MTPAIHTLAHEAMATTFEVRLVCDDAHYAEQAAQACFAEIDRLERLLSRFEATSEVACVARLAPGETLRLSADTFDCLGIALAMHELTGGAFDPTLGAELDRRRGEGPAFECGGPRGRLLLDPAGMAVQVVDGSVALDLGGVGKGYALDRMARILADWDIDRALLGAGGSSLLALGGPAPGVTWEVGLGATVSTHVLPLERAAVGSSGTAVQGAHIIDPTTGEPAARHFRAWAVAPTATEADALSTAFMVLSFDEIAEVCRHRPDLGAIVLRRSDAALECVGRVPPLQPAAESAPLSPVC